MTLTQFYGLLLSYFKYLNDMSLFDWEWTVIGFSKNWSAILIWNLFFLQLYHSCVFIIHSEIIRLHVPFIISSFWMLLFSVSWLFPLRVSLANKGTTHKNRNKQIKTGSISINLLIPSWSIIKVQIIEYHVKCMVNCIL